MESVAGKLTQCFLFQLSKEKLRVVPNEADEEQSRECSSVAYIAWIHCLLLNYLVREWERFFYTSLQKSMRVLFIPCAQLPSFSYPFLLRVDMPLSQYMRLRRAVRASHWTALATLVLWVQISLKRCFFPLSLFGYARIVLNFILFYIDSI